MQPELPSDVLPELNARPVEDPPWNGWDVVLVAVLTLVALFAAGLVVGGIAMAAGLHKGHPEQMNYDARIVLPIMSIGYVAMFALIYAVVTRRYHVPFAQGIRWMSDRWRPAALIFGGVALAFAAQIAQALLPIPKNVPFENYFRTMASAYLLSLFGVVVAPLAEEVFFRGFVYPVAARRLGLVGGVAFTGFLFALLHAAQLGYHWTLVLVMFGVGATLTAVRAATRSVAASVVVHATYNFTLAFMMWLGTGGFRHLEKATR